MPVDPQITLAGLADDLFGAAEPGQLWVQLVCPTNEIPRIPGTAIIASTAPDPIDLVDGEYDFDLWGNDVILPPGTFYTIKAVDANGNTVQINAYQFTGAGTFDLSNLTPYSPPTPTPPPSGVGFVFDEVPNGVIDGSNAVFTLTQAPTPPTSLNLYKNGARMTAGLAMNLSGVTITYEPDYVPQDGDTHIAGLYLIA